MRKLFLTFISINMFLINFGQAPKEPSSGEIYEAIQKLNFLGSVLYVGAHPDDENTAMISYFSNDVHARTAYLSMTRGDGGQNLIGPELRELLGVIRTQELLQARSIDGGLQFFTRANDFGFSKNPTETFQFWNKEQVLSDVVYVMRKFQPDVIIDRFDATTPGTTHGHHTASAILSTEAFDLTADRTKFPGQLKYVSTWQPKRLFLNESWFLHGSQEAFNQLDKSKYFKMDIGVFYPILGISNSEIAALGRSRHRSQGFGMIPLRGQQIEYLEPIEGGMPKSSVFEGINTTWSRIKGGATVGKILEKVQKDYDFKNPAASIPGLVKAYSALESIPDDGHWKAIKLQALKNIIADAAGLYLEAVASSSTAIAGEKIKINFEAINRSKAPIILNSVAINDQQMIFKSDLKDHDDIKFAEDFQIPTNEKPTNSYWLDEPHSLGMYQVPDQQLIGLPETPVPFTARFNLTVEGKGITVDRPLVYKFNNPARGQVYQPFVIVPKASVNVAEKVIIFKDALPKQVTVNVKSFTKNLHGVLKLKAPEGWLISDAQPVTLPQKNQIQSYTFTVTPPAQQNEAELIPDLTVDGKTLTRQVHEIDYDHIPDQKVLLPGIAKIVRMDIQKRGNKIGYINGAGDEVAESLRQIGYNVTILDPLNITVENLAKYDAVVLGVRAFNIDKTLKYKNQVLFDYVKNGGNLIVQYNVSRMPLTGSDNSLVTTAIAPYPLKLSADRVTDENSDVKFLHPDNPILNMPNKITDADFKGWVQERGLYFPDEWDKAFTPILSMHDKDEKPMDGSLLVAQYGKGYYVYTGLSFFRELPAGVPGAYKLFANMLSLGKK